MKRVSKEQLRKVYEERLHDYFTADSYRDLGVFVKRGKIAALNAFLVQLGVKPEEHQEWLNNVRRSIGIEI